MSAPVHKRQTHTDSVDLVATSSGSAALLGAEGENGPFILSQKAEHFAATPYPHTVHHGDAADLMKYPRPLRVAIIVTLALMSWSIIIAAYLIVKGA
jgi:hypothetical protein